MIQIRVKTLQYAPDSGWSADFPEVDPSRSLALCFGATRYVGVTDPVMDLVAAVGGPFSGCSTSGEIFGDRIVDGTLSVTVVEFEATPVKVVAESISTHRSFDAGVAIARQVVGDDLRGLFVLSEGLDVNGTELVRGINSIVSPGVTVTGGLAGDGGGFEPTWALVDGKPASGFVTAVGFYGDAVRIGHGSAGGCNRFGPERTVTKSRGNVVYELDGKPILALYKEYLGDLAADLPGSGRFFPLGLRQRGEDDLLVLTVLGIDEETHSLTFAGDVPQGSSVQLMRTSSHRVVSAAEDSVAMAMARSPSDVSLSIVVSCGARRLVLGERAEDEIEAVLHVLPEDVTQVGFYANGEISSSAEGGCHFHSQAMALTTIGEVT